MTEHLQGIISALPDSPGVYQYFDTAGKVIYVGKAKNLKRRVSSYFNREHDSVKIALLVKKIVDLQYVVVDSEEDALHLENSLIKQYQPRYNSMLKDDKSYPWICITNEPFPRVFQTRNLIRNGSLYYGPYSHGAASKLLLSLIKELYPIRNCRLDLSARLVERGNYRVCLQYHIKKCLGPCEGYIDENRYKEYIDDIRQILSGESMLLMNTLKKRMTEAADRLQFEEAQVHKLQIDTLASFQARSIIVSPSLRSLGVCSVVSDDEGAFFNYLEVANGSIIRGVTLEIQNVKSREEQAVLLTDALTGLIERFKVLPREIIVPFLPDFEFESFNFVVPQKGDKLKLLQLSLKNCKQYQVDKLKQREKVNPELRFDRILTRMQKDFQLSVLPRHIECFDNSNIQGAHAVSACVVFKNARPSKRDYRHFTVRTVEGPDDFATMKEVIHRRYSRLVEEQQPLPDLIVVDGGKGQLGVAYEVLCALSLQHRIAIIGIAKRLEEIFYPNDPIPLYLDKNSESLKIIQHLRDEAHRFGITHHRNKRSKAQLVSELDEIKGVGEKTKKLLLDTYKTVQRMRTLSQEELITLLGVSKGGLVFKALTEK